MVVLDFESVLPNGLFYLVFEARVDRPVCLHYLYVI